MSFLLAIGYISACITVLCALQLGIDGMRNKVRSADWEKARLYLIVASGLSAIVFTTLGR